MAAHHIVDWLQVRQDYLSDATASYSKLAKKYGVSVRSVETRGKKEAWGELRQSIGEKAFDNFQAQLLDDKSKSQNRHLQLFRNLQALCNKSMQTMATSNYAKDKRGGLLVVKDRDGNAVPIEVPVDPFELEKLARALKEAINGERVILGLPTSVNGISDPDGGNVWKGFSEAFQAARKVLADESTPS